MFLFVSLECLFFCLKWFCLFLCLFWNVCLSGVIVWNVRLFLSLLILNVFAGNVRFFLSFLFLLCALACSFVSFFVSFEC